MQTRRGVVAGLLATMAAAGGAAAGGAAPVWAAPVLGGRPKPRPFGDQVAPDLIAAAGLGGAISYLAIEGRTGAVVAAHNMDEAMAPASVTKAVTSLYALARLGADHRFKTRVLAVGQLRGSVLEGDLILAGGGDPTLNTDRLGDLAAVLAKMGLRQITGQFYYYEAALPYHRAIANDQPEHVGYNPSLSGLILNFNRAHFVWTKASDGWQGEMNAEGQRYNPPLRGIGVSIVAREAPLFIYDDRDLQESWSVAAASLGKGGSRWLPVRHPGRYAGEVFQSLCAIHGIRLPDVSELRALHNEGQVLAEDRSPPLVDLLKDMMRYSTNITAEAIGLATSGQSSLAQSAQMMTTWVRARFAVNAVFADHSGLGPGSRITARDMVKILSEAALTPNAPKLFDLMRAMAVAEVGDPNIMTFAKSGTLNFVSGLAGYLRKSDQKSLVFAIFSNDMARRDAVPIAARERPDGAAAWTKRARKMQRALIAHWAKTHF